MSMIHNIFADKTNYLIFLIVVMFGITITTRFLPFWVQSIFNRSLLLRRIGDHLPSVIMLLLLFNSFKNVSWSVAPFGIPEVACLAFAVLLYVWRKSMLLSLAASSIVYLLLVNFLLVKPVV